MLLIAVFMVACADRASVMGPVPPVHLKSISGKAVITGTVRRADAAPETIVREEALVSAKVEGGAASAMLRLERGDIEITLAVPVEKAPRQGVWDRAQFATLASSGWSVRYTASDGQPPSMAEYFENGVLFGRVSTTWVLVGSSWVSERRTVEILRDDGTYSVEIELEDLSFETRDTEAALATTDATADPVNRALAAANCQGQLDAFEDALAGFTAAGATAGLACVFGGFLGCGAATVGLLYAAYKLDAAEARLDRCLAAM